MGECEFCKTSDGTCAWRVTGGPELILCDNCFECYQESEAAIQAEEERDRMNLGYYG